MKVNTMNFPHPVLTEYSKDFIDCSFELSIEGQEDKSDNLEIQIGYSLKSSGISKLVKSKAADVLLRVICYKTSYRTVFHLIEDVTTISIPKELVADTIKLQGIIVASEDIDEYRLDEFNPLYFGGVPFKLRKGDILANEPGIIIKLNTIFEDEASGVVFVSYDNEISEMKVNYAKTDETNENLSDYIVVILPEAEYKNYAKLRTKKYLKHGIERFLQASLIIPAVTEGLSRLRMEECVEPDDSDDATYSGTIWAESFRSGLKKLGIESLENCPYSDYELANKLLGNVESNSIDNLMQKMKEWSTIRQAEDDII